MKKSKEEKKWEYLYRLGVAELCPRCGYGFVRGRIISTKTGGVTITVCEDCGGTGYQKKLDKTVKG